MLILVVAVSMTMGASATSYIPDDVTYQNLNGQQLAIKTYTLLPDQDPSDLYEDDFEYDGFLYSMSDIVKEEQRYQEENAHTEVVTVTTASKNLEDKLCVGCLLIVYTGKVGAVRQHIEIAFTQLRRPLGSLFFKRGYANKAHILLNLHLFQAPVEG